MHTNIHTYIHINKQTNFQFLSGIKLVPKLYVAFEELINNDISLCGIDLAYFNFDFKENLGRQLTYI